MKVGDINCVTLSVPCAGEFRQGYFEITGLESFLCTTEIENFGTGITTVGTGRVGMGLASSSQKMD